MGSNCEASACVDCTGCFARPGDGGDATITDMPVLPGISVSTITPVLSTLPKISACADWARTRPSTTADRTDGAEAVGARRVAACTRMMDLRSCSDCGAQSRTRQWGDFPFF